MNAKSITLVLAIVLGNLLLALPGFGQMSPGILSNSSIRGNLSNHIVSTPQRTPVSIQRVPYALPAVTINDVKRLQQISKLERELVIIKTTKTAWMEFDANLIFNPNQPTLRKSAKALLDKVIAYNGLSCGKGFSVDYDFAGGGDSQEMGMERSFALVNYLSQKSGLSPGWFSIPQPEPVERIGVRSFEYPGERSRDPKSVINIRIQR